ncbi:glycerol-3-phosphate dehydrogenase/oxidase [Rhodoferax saidenbachensis]|uniref:FAD-dependent oxidoreductase n=1 Tax=Rhodoferax saidenbachensis TaxID=1484693 RepID=A0A1P8KAZ7_9BURK|nr:glycerol-3-phosphate dehydrogenase/oxidase [Rhodoferax saidenbachensis]APW43176.1 hypothetical protein RS694_12000 [Rhodoferax saidenbachensis]
MRSQALELAAGQAWDLVVIGGGITGASVLREAARSGLRSLLLEQRDFAWGASSRSGKWVHGGLRYLQQGQMNVTWHSVRQREKLCHELTGLIDMQPMLWPLYKGQLADEVLIRAGLFVYDLIAGKRWRRSMPLAAVQQAFPDLHAPHLKGGICFYEGQTDDARMTLRVLQEARKAGGVALNYAPVVGLHREGNLVRGVQVATSSAQEPLRIQAKQVIAATGAWSDGIRAHVAHDKNSRLRPLRGSHLVFDRVRLPIDATIVLKHPRDRRPGFIAPFQGRVIVGNTDLDHDQDMRKEASITPWEVDYLLETVQHYFPALQIGRQDIIATFSGVRPVVDSGASDPSAESRDHVVWHEDELITIGGGKLTTFQHIALDALQRAKAKFPQMKLDGPPGPILTQPNPSLGVPDSLSAAQWQRLQGRYGDAASAMVLAAEPGTLTLIPGTETLWAELVWCAAHEDVQHLDDLLLRRTRIGILLAEGGRSYMPRIRELTQPALGWADDQWHAEEARYLEICRQHYSVPPVPGSDA